MSKKTMKRLKLTLLLSLSTLLLSLPLLAQFSTNAPGVLNTGGGFTNSPPQTNNPGSGFNPMPNGYVGYFTGNGAGLTNANYVSSTNGTMLFSGSVAVPIYSGTNHVEVVGATRVTAVNGIYYWNTNLTCFTNGAWRLWSDSTSSVLAIGTNQNDLGSFEGQAYIDGPDYVTPLTKLNITNAYNAYNWQFNDGVDFPAESGLCIRGDLSAFSTNALVTEAGRYGSNALYVDVITGNDHLATRGPYHPFASLGAAGVAAQYGDTIFIAPGTYSSPGAKFPAGINIIGSGRGVTVLNGSVTMGVSNLLANLTVDGIVNTSGSARLILNNIVIEAYGMADGIYCYSGGYVEGWNCYIHSSWDTWSGIAAGEFHDCTFRVDYRSGYSTTGRALHIDGSQPFNMYGGSLEAYGFVTNGCIVVESGSVTAPVELSGVKLKYSSGAGTPYAVIYYGNTGHTNVTTYGHLIKTNDVFGGKITAIGD